MKYKYTHTTPSTDLGASQGNSPVTNSDSLSPPLSPEQPARSDDITTDNNPPASKRPALGPSGHCDDVAQFINTVTAPVQTGTVSAH